MEWVHSVAMVRAIYLNGIDLSELLNNESQTYREVLDQQEPH